MNASGVSVLAGVLVGLLGISLVWISTASADTFGTGANQFTLDFVPISCATNPTSGYGIVNNDYRMGVYEITNDQWYKFASSLGVAVMGDPSSAYDMGSGWSGASIPTSNVSWYEAAQFVNWLNTSTGYQAAYRFTGTQGTADYALATWTSAEADNGTNLYRHKDAFYYLPTEDEWMKAAYWNGTSLQTYATKSGETLHQGDGTSGTGWNYFDSGYATEVYGPWGVGSGSEELNGTYDMMGNMFEWTESPYYSGDYGLGSDRVIRGGSFYYRDDVSTLASSCLDRNCTPIIEYYFFGFRVASEVPEPCSAVLLLIGSLMLIRHRRY